MRTTRRKTALAIGVSAIAVAGSVTAVAQVGGDERTPSSEPRTPSVESDVRSRLGVLDTARGTDDVMPPEATAAVDRLSPYGANPALARRAVANHLGTAYVLPANRGGCVLVVFTAAHVAQHCATVAELDSGQPAPASLLTGCEKPDPSKPGTCDRMTVFGVVPDGVTSVSVRRASGGATRSSVEGNAYLVEIPLAERPTALTYSGSAGDATVEIPGSGISAR